MNRKISFDCVVAWWLGLSDEQKSAFGDDTTKVAAFLDARAKEIEENTFVIHLLDKEAIQFLIQHKGYISYKAQAIVKAWRKYAILMGYNGPVAWKVKQGFTLKTHAPLAGPCYENLEYLQNWRFEDTSTLDTLVFWIPRLVHNSMSKTVTEMEQYRGELQVHYEMPTNHCISFGSIALQFALLLTHFKRTGERVLPGGFYMVSDTLNLDGSCRLVAGNFGSDGLSCYDWNGSCGSHDVGFFLIGIEEFKPVES